MTSFWVAFSVFWVLTFASFLLIEALSSGFGHSSWIKGIWVKVILSSTVVGLIAGLVVHGAVNLIGMLLN